MFVYNAYIRYLDGDGNTTFEHLGSALDEKKALEFIHTDRHFSWGPKYQTIIKGKRADDNDLISSESGCYYLIETVDIETSFQFMCKACSLGIVFNI